MNFSPDKAAYLSSNRTLFNQEGIWADITDGEKKRINDTISMFPLDVLTILNVGCGDGRVTNTLTDKYRVCGVDINITPLRRTQGLSIVASAESLPFADRSFDLVLVTEMLEHLPECLMLQVLVELQRVARKYILLTVPNEEVLEVNMTWCSGCRRSYHLWNHLNTFDRRSLQRLFPGFVTRRTQEFGFLVPRAFRMLHLIGQKWGRVWSYSEASVCPSCGSVNSNKPKENLFGYLLERLLWRLQGVKALQRPAFLGALYERDGRAE